jgi:hypothetical protein
MNIYAVGWNGGMQKLQNFRMETLRKYTRWTEVTSEGTAE